MNSKILIYINLNVNKPISDIASIQSEIFSQLYTKQPRMELTLYRS